MHASHKNDSRVSDKAPCEPGCGGKFGIPGCSCLLDSLLADRRAQTSAKKFFSQVLEHFAIEGSNFLHGIMTCGESWFCHFDPETKQESMEWHRTSPKKTKLKQCCQSIRQWELPFGMLVDFLPQVECCSAICFQQMCQKFHHALCDKQPRKKMTILQHDNTWLHSDYLCKERIQKNRWQLLPHQQLFTPDQTPLDYHLFGIVKDQMQGQRYGMTEAVQKATYTICEQMKWCFTTKRSSRKVAKMHQSGWRILQRSECNTQISLLWYFVTYN